MKVEQEEGAFVARDMWVVLGCIENGIENEDHPARKKVRALKSLSWLVYLGLGNYVLGDLQDRVSGRPVSRRVVPTGFVPGSPRRVGLNNRTDSRPYILHFLSFFYIVHQNGDAETAMMRRGGMVADPPLHTPWLASAPRVSLLPKYFGSESPCMKSKRVNRRRKSPEETCARVRRLSSPPHLTTPRPCRQDGDNPPVVHPLHPSLLSPLRPTLWLYWSGSGGGEERKARKQRPLEHFSRRRMRARSAEPEPCLRGGVGVAQEEGRRGEDALSQKNRSSLAIDYDMTQFGRS